MQRGGQQTIYFLNFINSCQDMSNSKAHVLVYPFPAPGHIIPLLDFTHHLLSRGLNATVLLTPDTLPLLDPLLSYHPSSSLEPLLLPSPEISTNPTENKTPGPLAKLLGSRDLHHPILLQWFRSHQSPPVAIISDFFLGWTQQLASEVGIARVMFSPTGAFGLSMFLTQDLPEVDDPNNLYSLAKFPNLPHYPAIPWYQIPPLYRNSKEGEPRWEFIKNSALGNLHSWGMVLNTSTHLEQFHIEHLKNQVGHNRVWAVGPVLPKEYDLIGRPGDRWGSSSVPCHEVMTWLDAHKNESVIYVCFGSRGVLTRKQMDRLATALEKSGLNFVWCVKVPNETQSAGDYSDVPEEFEDLLARKGYTIRGWAPQVEILRHRAVGVFLTHCGWNSMLEGILAGVVMMTWPMGAEQFLNARLLVEQLGVGIRVGEGTQNIPESTELVRLLIESVDESRPERAKAKELRDAVLSGVGKGGSSDKDLDGFVKSLNELAC